jgi:hypothetical protein
MFDPFRKLPGSARYGAGIFCVVEEIRNTGFGMKPAEFILQGTRRESAIKAWTV